MLVMRLAERLMVLAVAKYPVPLAEMLVVEAPPLNVCSALKMSPTPVHRHYGPSL